MRKLLLIIVLLVMSISVMGCETIKGVGKDLQNTGDNIWDVVTKK